MLTFVYQKIFELIFFSSGVTLAYYNVKFIDMFSVNVDCSLELKVIDPVKKIRIFQITWGGPQLATFVSHFIQSLTLLRQCETFLLQTTLETDFHNLWLANLSSCFFLNLLKSILFKVTFTCSFGLPVATMSC